MLKISFTTTKDHFYKYPDRYYGLDLFILYGPREQTEDKSF